MGKAILILDEMPECCEECPVMQNIADSGFYGVCMSTLKDDEYLYHEDRGETRPNWCLLKPLPQKKEEIDVMDTITSGYGRRTIMLEKVIEKARQQGYNTCLKDILGEE